MSAAAPLISPVLRWCDVIYFFTKADFGQRYKRSSSSVFFTMFEPIALISVIFVSRWLATGQFDWNDAVFHTSGVVPFYLFMHISQRMRGVDLAYPIPGVTFFDRSMAVVLAEAMGKLIVGVLIFAALYWFCGAKTAVPNHVIGLFPPLLALCVLGYGVGLFNSGVATYMPSWLYIYAICMRFLMLCSGMVMRPDSMPVSSRYLTVGDPIFHAITWFRVEYFNAYPSGLLDKRYLFACTAASVVIGSVVHRLTRIGR